LVLVGGELSEIRKIKDEYQLRNLILIDRQPHTKIPYYLKAADVLVLPNKKGDAMSEKYTSPLKLFEYMAAGRPIVASDLSSIREILNDKNAVLVVPNNPHMLAGGIRKILEDQEFAGQLVSQGFSDVHNYSWEKRTDKILNFINGAKQ
jgi:glycosyltransferase involved in cell wall biosynthesis